MAAGVCGRVQGWATGVGCGVVGGVFDVNVVPRATSKREASDAILICAMRYT
jgi:hypothetical protein